MANDNIKYLAVIGVIVVFVVGLGAGVLFASANNTSSSNSNQPYKLTMVVTDNNMFNASVGPQPAFFVVQGGQFVSSANINLPVNTKIEVTIFCYDSGADTPTLATATNVTTGTGTNTMFYENDTLMNASYISSSTPIQMNDQGANISYFAQPAHTFTVFEPGSSTNVAVNIPVPASSVTVTTIMFKTKGTYDWQCEIPCGSANSGWQGAMATAGWMLGTVTVS